MTRKPPPDPDNINDSRAKWAGAALSTFIKVTGTDQEDALGDLLADLMHWAIATAMISTRPLSVPAGITRPRRSENGPLDLRNRWGLPARLQRPLTPALIPCQPSGSYPYPVSVNHHRVRASATPAFGCIIPIPQRDRCHWRAGVCPTVVLASVRDRAAATSYASSHPRGFHEAPETQVSLKWQHGSFPSITMQSTFTGVSPMLCIGQMEPFQPVPSASKPVYSHAAPGKPRDGKQEIVAGNRRSCHYSAPMKLSVIVCTRNRAHAIVGCLDSIAGAFAKASPLEAEIIVVDNASDDDTSAVVHEWAASCAFPLRLLQEPRKGLSVARNCGIRAARGELLAFTDDDCRLDPDYVVDLLAHSQSDKVPTLRGGRVELGDPLDLPLTIKTDDEAADYAHPMHPAGFIHGANMTMPRTVVDSLGLFDERFGAGTKFPGEDCDYIIRAHIAGIRVQYVPDMVVYHFHGRRDKGSAQRLMAGYMRANGALYVKHLWSSPLLIRHLCWDIKYWFKEMRGQEKLLVSEVDIGHRQIVVGNVIGMIHFSAVQTREYLLTFFRLRS